MIGKIKKIKNNRGAIIIQTIVFASVSIIIITALASFTATSIKLGRETFNREQGFQSAEAGTDYYRWHLAHAPSDYQDGTGGAGPYVHQLKDKDGNTIGQFSLTITAPSEGSTLVKIKSTGTSAADSTLRRIILTQVAMPSIAEHAFAGNDAMRFGIGTEVFGSIHSNGGIRFDGLAHNLVTSGVSTYTDTDSDACTGTNSYGVHTCLAPQDPKSPNVLPLRADVFLAGRKMSQPTIDFSGFTSDMANLKTLAQGSNGFYRDTAGTGFVGYHIVLKTNDTFDLYKINSWVALPNTCITNSSNPLGLTWSINTQTIQGNYPFPTNGVIFIQDHLVVDGQINSARLTIAAALLPEPSDTTQFKNIIINNDLSYTNYDGTDSLGLVAQGGVQVGMISDDNLKIDGALMAEHNSVGRFYYDNAPSKTCSAVYKSRSVISLYGMIASYARYGFAYGSPPTSGYTTRNINYDANLLYAPPPSFPLTSDQYQILSWQEVKN
jgi:hypothetical protein